MKKAKIQIPKLKAYLKEKGISQKEFRENCKFSTTTASRLINKGVGSRSTILLASYVLEVSLEEMEQLLEME